MSACMKSHRYVKVFPQQVVGLLGPCVSLQEATTQREALKYNVIDTWCGHVSVL